MWFMNYNVAYAFVVCVQICGSAELPPNYFANS